MSGLGKLVLDGGDTHHGLSGLVRPFLGAHSADFIDWVYYSMWTINIIAEAVAATSFYNFGFLIFLLGFCFHFSYFNDAHQSLLGSFICRNRILVGVC